MRPLRRLTSAFVFMLAAACANSPNPISPTPVPGSSLPTSLVGVWRGYAQITACSDCRTGDTVPFILSAANDASGNYIAAVELFEWDIELTGTRQPDGAVLFAGVRVVNAQDPPLTRASATLRVGASANSGLAGTIEWDWAYNGRQSTRTLQILSASHDPINLSPVGQWRGRTVQTSCSGHCQSSARGDVAIALTLWQTSSGLAGTLDESLGGGGLPIPMTGTLSGTLVAMSGGTAPGRLLRRIEPFQLTMNALGRLSGRLQASIAATTHNAPEGALFHVQSDIRYLARVW